MKSIRIHQHGGPEVLKIDNLPVPRLSDPAYAGLSHPILVRIHAAAMNHLDLWIRQGLPGLKLPLPRVLGCEGSGVVEEVSAGVRNFKKGDEVVIAPGRGCGRCESCLSGHDNFCLDYGIYGETEDGLDCEHKVVPEENLFRKPANITFEEAAAIPLTFLTAWQMLVDRGGIAPGQQVLILAAASGVGSAGVQIAKLFRARIIATVGSDDKIPRIKELGADEVINHRTQDFAEEVQRLTNRRGVDIVFEHVGAATWEKSLKSLAFGGRLVTCGATTGQEVKILLRHLFRKQQQVIGSTMGPKASLFKILKLVEERRLLPVLDQVFPFSEVQQAHWRLEEGSPFGKVVLKIST